MRRGKINRKTRLKVLVGAVELFGALGLELNAEQRAAVEKAQTQEEERKAYLQEYRTVNRDRINARNLAYQAEHWEQVYAKHREYIAAHHEERREYIKAWRVAYKDRQNALQQAWRVAHREEKNAKQRAYRAARREELKEKDREYHRKYYAAKKAARATPVNPEIRDEGNAIEDPRAAKNP